MSSPYPTSQWTQVREIQCASPDERRVLLGRFIEHYLPAIRADIERYMPQDQPDDIDDALHEFIADKLYDGFVIDQADSKRGRLSRYIRACIHHFVYTKKSKRVRVIIPETVGDDFFKLGQTLICNDSHQDKVDFEWVTLTLREAIIKTKDELTRKNKHAVWHVLEARLLCDNTQIEPFKTIANRLGLTNKEAANLLITGKRALRRNIFAVVAEHVPNSNDIEADVLDACTHVSRERLSFGIDS